MNLRTADISTDFTDKDREINEAGIYSPKRFKKRQLAFNEAALISG